jgi:hypothetical protein
VRICANQVIAGAGSGWSCLNAWRLNAPPVESAHPAHFYGPSLGLAARPIRHLRWDQAQIVVQSLRTGERTVVLRGGSDARYVPTGHLVYALEGGLFAVAFDADRLEVQGGAVSVVEGLMRAGGGANPAATANYGVSEQGTLVYVTVGGAQSRPRSASSGLTGRGARGRWPRLRAATSIRGCRRMGPA